MSDHEFNESLSPKHQEQQYANEVDEEKPAHSHDDRNPWYTRDES
jgi:hypothetical protein